MSGYTSPNRYWVVVLAWMILIFVGSTDLLSSAHTSRFIWPFLRWLKPDISDVTLGHVQFAVRKGGHLTEYAVLAMLITRALHGCARLQPVPWVWKDAALALLFSALYAVSDEVHQAFVPSRGPSVMDVLIDCLGALLGLACLWGVGCWRRRP